MFRALLAGTGPTEDEPWVSIGDDGSTDLNPLAYLDKWFTAYISERRGAPVQDILTELATQHFPDGTLPEVVDVVRVATFLFIAGHETTARLLTSALHVLAENPDLQNTLRNNRDRIPNFVEEVLRLESPIKSDFRLARVATTPGRGRHPGRHEDHAVAWRGESGSGSFRLPGRTTGGSDQRPAERGVRARRAQLPGRPARQDRGAGDDRANSGQAQRYSARRGAPWTTG